MEVPRRLPNPGDPAWIIAEIGVNHDGSPERALELIELAASSGADVVKFQMFRADRLARAGAPLSNYQRRPGRPDADQQDLLTRLELPDEVWPELRDRAEALGLVFMASPFDEESLQSLVELGVPVLKLGSGELTHVPLLRQAAMSGLPLILSTGMASWDEIHRAVAIVRESGASDPVLLQCVSLYPTPVDLANVSAVRTVAERTGCPTGYSDHTETHEASLAARALGACVIERHFTHDRWADGPDHAASLDPTDFTNWVASVRRLESSLGDGEKEHRSEEEENRYKVRRAVVTRVAVAAGERLDEARLTTLRPADGLGASEWDRVVGARALRDLVPGQAIHAEDIEVDPEGEGRDVMKEELSAR